jgi:hypothetical protein
MPRRHRQCGRGRLRKVRGSGPTRVDPGMPAQDAKNACLETSKTDRVVFVSLNIDNNVATGMASGSRAVTPDSVRGAVQAGRDLLDEAEALHACMNPSCMFPPMSSRPRYVARSCHVAMVDNPIIHRMSNFPMIPVVGNTENWVPQFRFMHAAARVALAYNIKARPSLARDSPMATWRTTTIMAVAARAAAWDYLGWTPTEYVTRILADGVTSAGLTSELSGREITSLMSSSPAPQIEPAQAVTMCAVYDAWPTAFRAGYQATMGDARSTRDVVRPVRSAIAENTPLGQVMVQLGDSTLEIVCAAALTAVPRQMWNPVARSLDMPDEWDSPDDLPGSGWESPA